MLHAAAMGFTCCPSKTCSSFLLSTSTCVRHWRGREGECVGLQRAPEIPERPCDPTPTGVVLRWPRGRLLLAITSAMLRRVSRVGRRRASRREACTGGSYTHRPAGVTDRRCQLHGHRLAAHRLVSGGPGQARGIQLQADVNERLWTAFRAELLVGSPPHLTPHHSQAS